MLRRLAIGVSAAASWATVVGAPLVFRSGETGKVTVPKDVRADGIVIDVADPELKHRGGVLTVDGPGVITVGADGVKDVTRGGRYCVLNVPLAFAANQVWDCGGTSQLYFYGRLSDADPKRPVSVVKRGCRALYLGEQAAESPFAGEVRVENGQLCFLGKNCLGTRGGIVLTDYGSLWYGGGSNGRDVTVAESCLSEVCLRADTWGKISEQGGRVTLKSKAPRVRVEAGRTLILSGGVRFAKGCKARFDLQGDATLIVSGKPWKGEAAVGFAGTGTVELKGNHVFDDDDLDFVVGAGCVVRLNGTEQRIGALTLKKGATVAGPGKLVTKAGTFDLPKGGLLGGVGEKEAPTVDWAQPVKIGKELQLLWDDDIADVGATTAARRMHRPEFAGTVHVFNKPWEGDCCFYGTFVQDDGHVRFYYKAYGCKACEQYSPGVFQYHWKMYSSYIESRDKGFTWTYPDFNRVDINGSKHNNAFLDEFRDNFYVFKDPNPACPPEERYKALSMWAFFNDNGTPDPSKGQPGLWCYVSSDGNNFRRDRLATEKGAFDSLNTAFWDAERGEYHAYVRGYHERKGDRNGDNSVRDVRHMVSKDFRTWSDPQLLDFGPGKEDYSLYTNGIHPYYRKPSVYIGFPARYVERKEWTDNYDKLCAPDKRKERMKGGRRGGLTVWDTIFCFSRDGQRFDRFDEAMFRPGPEHPEKNWAYGDTMVTVGEIETPGRFGVDPEMSLFVLEGAHLFVPNKLNRYTIRLDGFVSRHASYAGARFVTRPLVFDGSELVLNFSTSARGFVRITLRDATGRELKSTELFGDKVNRIVGWEKDELKAFAGKPVTLTFEMSDADIYSFRFR